MTLNTDIQACLEKRLAALDGVPQIAYDGVSFTPTVGTPFVAPVILPAFERPATMGDDPIIQHEGSFEVAVVYPGGRGLGAAIEMADSIRLWFPTNLVLTEGTTKVRLRYAERRPHFVDSDWIRVPVSIGWYLFST